MSRGVSNLDDDTDVVIRCGSKSQAQAVVAYFDECQLDFIKECTKKGLKIRYFDVEHETNIIVID